jgi:hypothetical protein
LIFVDRVIRTSNGSFRITCKIWYAIEKNWRI